MITISSDQEFGIAQPPREGVTEQHALQSFFFSFKNGDHHLNRLSLLKNGARMRVAFKDKNSDDPWQFEATYERIADIPMQRVRGRLARGAARRISVPGLGPATHFALNGFEFRLDGNAAGQDRHVKRIVLLPNENDGTLALSFGDADLGEDVDFKVQYQVVPRARVSGTLDQEETSGGAFIPHPVGAETRRILSGFSFTYHGFDQHLLQVGVNTITSRVWFQDNDGREAVRWRVKYFVLA